MRPRLSDFAIDLGLAARAAFGRRARAVLVLVIVAVVLGLSTAFFTLWHGARYRAHDVEAAHRLVGLQPLSPELYEDMRARLRGFSALGVARRAYGVIEAREPVRVQTARVSRGWLPAVRPRLVHGAWFSDWDFLPWTDPTGIISERLWRQVYDADANIIGRTLRWQGGGAIRIVGVMSDRFAAPRASLAGTEVWLPWLDGALHAHKDPISGVGRLADGVSAKAARRELDDLLSSYPGPAPGLEEGVQIAFVPFGVDDWEVHLDALFGMWLASLFLLVVGCANLGTHLLARALDRRRERALAVASGASPARLVRETVLAAMLHAALGAGLAIPIAGAVIDLVQTYHFTLAPNPGFRHAAIGVPALIHLVGAAALVAVAIALPGATQIPRTSLQAALAASARTHTGSRRTRRAREILLALQVALGLLLIIMAGATSNEIVRRTEAKGFSASGVLHLRTEFFSKELRERQDAFKRGVVDRLRAHAAVVGVAHVFPEPLAHLGDLPPRSKFVVHGRTKRDATLTGRAHRRTVGGDFLAVLDIPLLRGRWFVDEVSQAPVAVVDQAFAEEFFPGLDPLGYFLRPAPNDDWHEIIGVVGSVKHAAGAEIEPAYYLSFNHRRDDTTTFLVRTSGDEATVMNALVQAVRDEDARQPVVSVGRYTDVIAARMSSHVVQAATTTTMGLCALLLTALGLQGAAHALVISRTNELGLRAAVGASPARLLGLVLRQGLRPIGWGIVLGMAAGFATGNSTTFRAWYPDVLGLEYPGQIAAVAVTLLAALVALARPALRARRIHPHAALRYE